MNNIFSILKRKNSILSLRYIIVGGMLLVITFSFFFFKIYDFSSPSFFYIETSFGDVVSEGNTTEQYIEHCKSNIQGSDICEKIYKGFFYDAFYGECRAIQERELSFCNLLKREEGRRFCRNNFIIHESIIDNDINTCEMLGETLSGITTSLGIELRPEGYNEIGHNNKDNIEFCRNLVYFSSIQDDTDIQSKVLDYVLEERFLPRTLALISQDSSYCLGARGIDERVKCQIYTGDIQCERLSDIQYIYQLINETSHFYDNGTDGL